MSAGVDQENKLVRTRAQLSQARIAQQAHQQGTVGWRSAQQRIDRLLDEYLELRQGPVISP